jgi:mono/diheme cytochrome c family protein
MIAVIIIAVVFTGIAVATAYFASKGSFSIVGDALQTTSRSGSRILNTTLVIVYVGGALALPLIFVLGNRAKSNAQVGGIKLTAAMQDGRELFAQHCAVCHTLSADNAVGKVGPNLDQLKPTDAIVLHTIKYGCLQDAAAAGTGYCLGYGNMPAGVVQGRQASDVAAFVSRVAGHL